MPALLTGFGEDGHLMERDRTFCQSRYGYGALPQRLQVHVPAQ